MLFTCIQLPAVLKKFSKVNMNILKCGGFLYIHIYLSDMAMYDYFFISISQPGCKYSKHKV